MTQQFKSDKKAMTLVELILAIMLLNVIILTGLSMELGMRRIFSSTDSEAQLLAEAMPIMAMVEKDINQAVGDVKVAADNASYNDTAGGDVQYYIRRDVNKDGVVDSGDVFSEYYFQSAANTLEYRPNSTGGSYALLSDRVTQFLIFIPVNGVSSISLTLRKNASLAASYTNPQITLVSKAQYRGFSYN